MKLTRFLFITVLLLLIVGSQPAISDTNGKGKFVVEEWEIYIECMDEWATGNVIYSWKEGPISIQWKIKGTVIGELTENEYEISEVQNFRWEKDKINGAINNNTIYNLSISINGEEVGVVHFNIHANVNANEIETSDVRHYVMKCY